MAGGHPLGCPPSSYKRSPSSHLSLTPPREGSLSSSRIYPPWSQTSEIHVPGDILSRRSCCFRCIAGARRWRLFDGLNVCAVMDVLLSCGAGLLLGPKIGKCLTTSSTSSTSLHFVSRVCSLWMYIYPFPL